MPEQPDQGKQGLTKKLTPEQVKAISKRVYALLLSDLRLANERARLTRKTASRP